MKILIIGASARAAVGSAQRGGIETFAIDRFGDVDLAGCTQNIVLNRFPSGCTAAAAQLPEADFVYTGPLENRPRLLSRLAASRHLLGNPPDVVRRVRNPFRLMSTLRAADLEFPETRPGADEPTTGTWVRKPYRSGGGVGITEWRVPRKRARASVLQSFIPGPSIAAVYLAAQGVARLLGVTHQIVGADWCGSAPFCYSGSVGPLQISLAETEELIRIGQVLSAEFRLHGLFGVDAIRNSGRIYPVEVNPRYSASVEILERADQHSYLRDHVEACRFGVLPEIASPVKSLMHGKAIVYAQRSGVAPRFTVQDSEQPELADIPKPRTPVEKGQPLLTVFGSGKTVADVFRALQRRVSQIRELELE